MRPSLLENFAGDGNVFEGNVLVDVEYLGRVKSSGEGTSNLSIRNNTFYVSTAWAGFIWDVWGGGTITGVVFEDNIFHSVHGTSIHAEAGAMPLVNWDEWGNVFHDSTPPTGTTGASEGSSVEADPGFADPPGDFTVTHTELADKGAPWPLPCD